MTTSEIINVILCILSFLLAAISVVTVVITIRQSNKQLQEMRTERITREQPVLLVNNPVFYIEKPRFFCSGPQNEYKFLARFYFEGDIQNLSVYPATSVDISATLQVEENGEKLELSACSEHFMVIRANSETNSFSIMFTGDSDLKIFNALRASAAKYLPKLRVEILYKNLAGGNFKTKTSFILAPEESSEPHIRHWHERITSERIATKELIDVLERLPTEDPKANELFHKEAELFSAKLGKTEQAFAKCIEEKERFSITGITDTQYKKDTAQHVYNRYVHKQPNCE